MRRPPCMLAFGTRWGVIQCGKCRQPERDDADVHRTKHHRNGSRRLFEQRAISLNSLRSMTETCFASASGHGFAFR